MVVFSKIGKTVFISCVLLCLSVIEGLAAGGVENKTIMAGAKSDSAAYAYVRAYPDYIAAVEGEELVWKDKTRMPLCRSIGPRTFRDLVDNPDLAGQVSIPYPTAKTLPPGTFGLNTDPGRIRDTHFFKKMYGESKEDVAKNLVEITFCGQKVPVTRLNGVAEKLQQISEELAKLFEAHPDWQKYTAKIGGTFNWRNIAGTDRPSAHSFGMTIDINVDSSHYWLWDYKAKNSSCPSDITEKDIKDEGLPLYGQDKSIAWKFIPTEIIEIFEKYHFVWGGRWLHYDTMHFEYRPELFM
jgi:peptidoglycan L-alanyl-D-glutamate endopeptidase CwlK